MSFLFKACFEPQTVERDYEYQKEYHPKVDLLPEITRVKDRGEKERQPSIIANKLRARGNFDKPNLQKNYDQLALQTELYQEFLARKRADRSLWGTTFEQSAR